MTIKLFKLTAMALALAFLMGCTQSQILATLEASVTATEALVAALQAGGKISPEVANEIERAIAGLPAAYQSTAAELSSADSQAAKAAKIASYYASTIAALEVLPPEAQTYASAISASIHTFLSSLEQTQTGRAAAAGEGPSTMPRTVAASGASLEKTGAKQLKAISSRAAALEAQLAELQAGASEAGESGKR